MAVTPEVHDRERLNHCGSVTTNPNISMLHLNFHNDAQFNLVPNLKATTSGNSQNISLLAQ